MAEWTKIKGSPTDNETLQGLGFYISYAPHTLSGAFAGDSNGSGGETAIVSEGSFFILNGDHRYAYEGLVPEGLITCMAYFHEHQDQVSSWSD